MFSDAKMTGAVLPCGAKPRPKELHWLQIELVGEDDQPIPWEEYLVRLPDGTEVRGYLDEDGFAGFEGIENPGECQVSFPNLDREAWEKIATLPKKEPAA